jgi:hypothetical protein
MDYKQFTITAFERTSGSWRARIRRIRAKPFSASKVKPFETQKDSASAADALKVAMEVIDAGALRPRRRPERYWRPKRGALPARRRAIRILKTKAPRLYSPGSRRAP